MYLGYLLRNTAGDPATAAAAYYQGLGSVQSDGELPETRRLRRQRAGPAAIASAGAEGAKGGGPAVAAPYPWTSCPRKEPHHAGWPARARSRARRAREPPGARDMAKQINARSLARRPQGERRLPHRQGRAGRTWRRRSSAYGSACATRSSSEADAPERDLRLRPHGRGDRRGDRQDETRGPIVGARPRPTSPKASCRRNPPWAAAWSGALPDPRSTSRRRAATRRYRIDKVLP